MPLSLQSRVLMEQSHGSILPPPLANKIAVYIELTLLGGPAPETCADLPVQFSVRYTANYYIFRRQ